MLEPVSVAMSRAVLAGDLGEVSAASGWPHADTLIGLRLELDQTQPGDPAGWFVTLRDEPTPGAVIGECGWKGGPDSDGTAELGYGLAPLWRGQGYGTELVGALALWALRQPHCRRLVAEIHEGNVASRRLVERLGFTMERRESPYLYYTRTGETIPARQRGTR